MGFEWPCVTTSLSQASTAVDSPAVTGQRQVDGFAQLKHTVFERETCKVEKA